jgi:branched-chain amino acid transport system permease protein
MLFSEYYLTIMIFVGVWIIATLGLNIITGYAGQFHLGIGVYMGTGAYASALLTTGLGISFWFSLPIAVFVSSLMGLVTGLPALRVKEDFLAVATIGMVFVFESLLIYLPYFGGPIGIGSIPPPAWFGGPMPKVPYLVLVLLFVLVSVWVNLKLVNSWAGLAWESLREDELAASMTGTDIRRFKIFAFVVGGAYCGCAGVLYAHFMSYITPYDFGFLPSIYILAMLVFGGIGTIRGAVFGAAFLTVMPELFRFVQEYRNSIYGLLLVFMMLFEPKGLLGDGSFVWEKLLSLFRKSRSLTSSRGRA